MTTLRFKTLELSNFMSFGGQLASLELDDRGAVTIVGENVDAGFGSNGVGKTTIINAICYALYNKAFDNISLQRLINATNAIKNTQMMVRLTFDKDGFEYEIYRSRGAVYTVEIKRDGDDIAPGKGAIECDELIEDIIGISYDLFTKTVVFSGNSPAFLQLPIAQQRAQIEELFNITMLSEKAVLLRDEIRQTESDIKIADAVIKQQEGAVALQERHLVEAEQRLERWEKARAAEIAEIEQTLQLIGTVDFDREQELHEKRAELKETSTYLGNKLTQQKSSLVQLESSEKKLKKEHEHLSNALCPYCSQHFAGAPAKLEKVDGQMSELELKKAELQADLAKLQTSVDETKGLLAEVTGCIQHQNLTELLRARESSAGLRAKLESLGSAVNPHLEPLEKLLGEAEVKVDHERADSLRRRLDHQSFLLKLLTDKNSFLRRNIINKSIPFLNARLNVYTTALGLPHTVKFDADMSCTVAEFGRELDFGNLSAGEKKRVNTSMALAFRDVLHHLHTKTNLLLVDELDGALDQNGIDAVIRVLKEKSRDEGTSIFVISHHPSVAGRLDDNLIIRKINGFSEFVDE